MKLIDGKKIAKEIESNVKKEIELLVKNHGIRPCLATILVGEHPPSLLYVKLKHKAAERVGIKSLDYKLPKDVSEKEILELIESLNKNNEIHGILLQLPVPEHIDEQNLMAHISPKKDVDGFNPTNMGNMLINRDGFLPCTPEGILYALEYYNVEIQGKNAVIVGHSNVVGKPISVILLNRNATVSVCHVYTDNLSFYTKNADILIVATGVKSLIKADMVKQDAVVFDVGITWENGKVYGDVDFEGVYPKVKLITPVPGGVGPMTISILMQHTLKAAKYQKF